MMHLPVGTTLQGGKYRIVRFISSGGFGCTYEAEHTQLQSHVALKEFFVSDFCNRHEGTGEVSLATQIKAELLGKLRKKFIEEARAVFQMHHQHIVRVIDIFEENGTAYYAMDFIDGQSLHEMVKMRGKLPEGEAVKYILHIADALKYVHSLNRLHLDVKPGNIMVDKSGNAILIDFGASKHYDDESGENTSTLMGVNTKGYAPVELMNSSFSSFSPSADIYSLGATLYKLLTGITPPSSLSLVSDDEELKPLPTTISENVRDAVSVAMQLKRKARPQSIDEFVSIFGSSSTVAQPGVQVGNIGNEEVTSKAEETKLDEAKVVNDERPPEKKASPTAPPKPAPPRPESPKSDNYFKWFYGVIVVVGIIVLASLTLTIHNVLKEETTTTTTTTTASQTPRTDTIISSKSSSSNSTTITATKPTTGTINGHEWVELGLSVKWAKCNVGASSPSDYGDYYAWGETSTKSEYTEANSKTYGKSMGSIAGNPQYDAARANWGSTWRMPTAGEIAELVDRCTWKWTTQGGHNGYMVTGPNGNSIFLPSTQKGWSVGGYAMEYGTYWSATPYVDYAYDVYELHFSVCNGFYEVEKDWDCSRSDGNSVRPVTD